MKKLILIFTLLIQVIFISFDTFSQTIDTVNIYKSERGGKESYYFQRWFANDNNYSEYGKRNHQDSLVMFPTKTSYFKYYTRPNGRLILEGKNSWIGSYLDGEVKFYYKNGEIKRIENWGIREKDTCGVKLSVHDEPAPKDTWKYFDCKERLTQTDFFHIDILSCKPLSYKLIKTCNYYNTTGTLIKTTNELIESYTFEK